MTKSSLRIALVVPHIFMHRDILPKVIFSPGTLALDLYNGLTALGHEVTLFSPGPTQVENRVSADLKYFETELTGRGDTYMDLLKKHPFTFITLARQVQSEVIAKAYEMANNDLFDVVHIYTNEEDTALPFAALCRKPVVFTHHDPFNFLVKYKSSFPKYKQCNWLSLSYAQRLSMPSDTHWVGNIYHGTAVDTFEPIIHPTGDYVAFIGRIIEQKGVHIAIQAVRQYNQRYGTRLKLKIAGKHYSDYAKDTYWQTKVNPEFDEMIEYVGYISDVGEKQTFLGNARALIVPSTFDEPFGMVTIEALACATPVIGLNVGATQEIITNSRTGFIVEHNSETASAIADAIHNINLINRADCRKEFESRFTIEDMCQNHEAIYRTLTK